MPLCGAGPGPPVSGVVATNSIEASSATSPDTFVHT